VALPKGAPWTDVAFVGVYHDDAERVGKLLKFVRPWFTRIVVGIQTDDPDNDATLAVAREVADEVIVDSVHGIPEPTFGKVLAKADRIWSFLVSADESPSTKLLGSFQKVLDQHPRNDGFWIRFLSSIDGIDYPSEQDNHLRLFLTRLSWPTTMHSRPPATNAAFLGPEFGHIRHDRSLDEMMVDYLRYYEMGKTNKGWTAHNKLMMQEACSATAKAKGWEYVKGFEWWPSVRDIAFEGTDPE
jgi:hypothetical protein